MHGQMRMAALLTALFALPSFAQSTDDERHPLHGSWISHQSGSNGEREVTVTFYPDGSYHMVQTVEGDVFIGEEGDSSEEGGWEDFLAGGDSNGNGVFDEEDFEALRESGDEDLPSSWDDVLHELGDANGDGVIDQEEHEARLASEEGGWEDFLAEVDSNDNGVIDEEDFEAAQARGEDLPPTWDDVLQDMGDANRDGVIDEEEFMGKNPEADWQEEGSVVGFPRGVFDEEMIMTMVMTGTWEATDDRFTLVPVKLVLEINDMALVEFYTLFFGSLFDLAFQESGLSEEEFLSMMVQDNPESIDAPESLEEFIASQIGLMIQEITTGMTTDLPEVETFVFSIDSDEMTATNSVGDTLVFVHSDARSMVEASSWGQVKTLYR